MSTALTTIDSIPTTLDAFELATVFGGDNSETCVGLKTRLGSAGICYTTTPSPDRGNAYNNCMNDRQANCSWIQSAQSCQDMAQRACAPLLSQPQPQPQPSAGADLGGYGSDAAGAFWAGQ